jgi:hypothetical protein
MEACDPITAAMDLYALGVTLGEAGGGGADEVIHRRCAADPGRRPSVAAAVDRLSMTLPDDAQPWPRWAGADSP